MYEITPLMSGIPCPAETTTGWPFRIYGMSFW
jgi:hypothetical protein